MPAAPGDRVAVLADAHIGGPGGSGEGLAVQLDQLADAGCSHLVLLGDLFHVWVGSEKFETDDHRSVLAALRRLGERGVRLDYVEGNRDFFIADSVYAPLFERVDRSVEFTAGGRRYLAVHGDGIDRSDRKYLFWSWLSKSWLSRTLWLGLPAGLARSLADGTERRLAETNFEHKSRVPEGVLRRYGELQLQGEYEELLLGHFHQALEWDLPGGKLRVADAWFRTRAIEWLS